jgi:hypothetical protein
MLTSYYEDFNELILQTREMRDDRLTRAEAGRTLKEAEKVLKHMKIEITNITNPEKALVAKRKYRACEESLQEERRQILLGGGSQKQETMNETNKQELKHELKQAEREKINLERLKIAQQQLQESEEHAETTQTNLQLQRERILRSTTNVKTVNEELDQSNRLLTKMSRWWR